MMPRDPWKPSLSAFATCLLLQACSAVPVAPECPVKAEPPPALLIPPSDQALRNLYKILELPWPTSGESTSLTPPDTED